MTNTRSRHTSVAWVFLVMTSTQVAGFELGVHESIVRAALVGRMSPDGIDDVVGALILGDPGTGTRGSDLYQFSPERHFDGAPDHDTLCRHWGTAVDDRLDMVVALAVATDAEKRKLADPRRARRVFGAVVHALADFYSHTNWVELFAAQGKHAPPAPLLGSTCDFDRDALRIPGEVQSGFFSVPEMLPIYGPIGTPCPRNPPAGFRYCHEQLNKDSAEGKRGAELIPKLGKTYHEVARNLAIETTAAAWETVRQRMLQRYQESRIVDAECLFAKLSWGGERTCRRSWRIRASFVDYVHNESGFTRTEISGLDARLTWEPVRFSGPQLPNSQFVIESGASGGRAQWRTTIDEESCEAGAANSTDESGRVSVPLSIDDEAFDPTELLRFQFPTFNLECPGLYFHVPPSLGRPVGWSVEQHCNGPDFRLKLRTGRHELGPCFFKFTVQGGTVDLVRSMVVQLDVTTD